MAPWSVIFPSINDSDPPSKGLKAPAIVDRYAIFEEIASGGMATVHLGRLLGDGGFARIVAIKRLHPHLAGDSEFAAMFMEEARLAARIRHPNVVPTLDVVTAGKDLLLVMEYVHGVSLAALLTASRRSGKPVAPHLIAGVVAGALEGLHAAHEACNERGELLGLVHRDVSPENILVGVDGTPRILDFGVAKAVGKIHSTRAGQVKGKLSYMSPEQVRGHLVTRQSDLFSTAIVLWEALTGQRLFPGNNAAEILVHVLDAPLVRPRSLSRDVPARLDDLVMKGLSRDPADRFSTAREMAMALEAAVPIAPGRAIAAWVLAMSSETLADRAALLARIEQSSGALPLKAKATPPVHPTPTASASGARAVGHRERPISVVPEASHRTPRRSEYEASEQREEGAAVAEASARLAFPVPEAPTSGTALKRSRTASERERSEDRFRAQDALREHLEWPVRVIAAGVGISLLDWAVRDFTAELPIRPIRLAELLVSAGVVWAIARVFFPSFFSRRG